MINDYYDHTEALRDRLAERGLDSWSRELLIAERTASMSGEAINNIGIVLRQLREVELDSETKTAVERLLDEGDRIWKGG